MRAGDRAIVHLKALFDVMRAQRGHKAVAADHRLLHAALAAQQRRSGTSLFKQMLQHARDELVVKLLVLARGEFALAVIVLTAKAQKRLGIGQRVATVLTAIEIKLLERGHGQHVVHDGCERVHGCAQAVQQTVIADPLREIAVESGRVLFVVQPKLAKRLQRPRGIGAVQIDQLVHVQQNIAVIRRQIYVVGADIFTPPEIVCQLLLAHLPILRHIREESNLLGRLADDLAQIFTVAAEFLIVGIVGLPGVDRHAVHKPALHVPKCLRLGRCFGRPGLSYGGGAAELGLGIILLLLFIRVDLDQSGVGCARLALHGRTLCRHQPVNVPKLVQLVFTVFSTHNFSPIPYFL